MTCASGFAGSGWVGSSGSGIVGWECDGCCGGGESSEDGDEGELHFD